MANTDTILIVASNLQLRRALYDLLVMHLTQHCIVLASSDSAAIHLAQGREFQALIVDLDMPRGGGLERIRRLRAVCPNTPLLALGLEEGKMYMTAATDAGATDYVSKATLSSQLILTLGKAVPSCIHSK